MNKTNITRPFLLLILLGLVICNVTAQKKKRNDTIKSWEVGSDLLWLIDKNQQPGQSIFVRTNFVTEKNKLRAWRLRFGLNMSYRDSTNIGDPLDNELNDIFILARVGYEWQFKVEENALLYYGVDLGFSYSRIYEKRILTLLPPPGVLYQDTFTTYTPEVIGFIGCRYNPRPWVSLSLEASMQVAYRIRRNPFKATNLNFPDDEGDHGLRNAEELKINLVPITYLNISFHINRK